MLHVDDDMDNLFRKAAENYSLKSDNSDWEKVSGRLQRDDNEEENKTTPKKNYRYVLWLCLLLPFAWICNHYTGSQSSPPVTTNHKVSTSPGALPGNVAEKSTGNKTAENNMPAAPISNDNASSASPDPGSATNTHIRETRRNEGLIATTNQNQTEKINAGSSNFSKIPQTVPGKVPADNTFTTIPPVTSNETLKDNVNEIDVRATEDDIKAVQNALALPRETLKDSASIENSAAKNKQKDDKKKLRRLYVGAFLGPDVTAVNFQSVKNVGWGAGVLAGYQFNKKLSFEALLSLDKKFYYSNGEYFDTRGTALSAWKIDDISGKCKMITVSVNGKYDFASTAKQGWFFTLGMSSYSMKTEDYNYSYKYNGMERQKQISYKNESHDLLSTADISLGYTRKIRSTLNLRLEPYLRVPVKGIGAGDLHIMSAGFKLGIVKKIF